MASHWSKIQLLITVHFFNEEMTEAKTGTIYWNSNLNSNTFLGVMVEYVTARFFIILFLFVVIA